MKSFPVRCSVRTNPSKVRSKHRTADLCPTCIKFPYVNINTAGIHSPLRPVPGAQGPRHVDHAPRLTGPRNPKWRTQYHCPSIPMSIHWRHKVNYNIMYTFKCLPGRSQACNPRPPQLPCTESQSADTALPASQNNETPTTCSAVQNTMYKSKCLPGRSQACKPRPP